MLAERETPDTPAVQLGDFVRSTLVGVVCSVVECFTTLTPVVPVASVVVRLANGKRDKERGS